MPEEPLSGRRVLVTGSAGVIGLELLDRLQARGAQVLSVDREALPPGERPGVRHLRLDLSADDLRRLRDFEADTLLHLAASFERSAESPDFWGVNWRDNVLATHRTAALLGEAASIRTCVFASSYLVYDPSLYTFREAPPRPATLKEDAAVAPRNLCGAAKRYGESEIDFVARVVRGDVRVAHARIFRSYGRRSRDVISRWVRALLDGEPIEVYNGASAFDYVWAGDVAEGMIHLALAPSASGPINLARGRSRKVAEVVEILGRLVPSAPGPVRDLGTREAFEASCADLARLREAAGWSPATDLEEGIARIVEFEKERRGGQR